MLVARRGQWLQSSLLRGSAGLLLVLIGSCQKVVGLPDTDVAQMQCEEYCDLALAECPQERKPMNVAEDRDDRVHRPFASKPECMAFCGQLYPVQEKEGGESPLACRIARLKSLVPKDGGVVDDAMRRSACNDASPTGGTQCGKDMCATFCSIFAHVCSASCRPKDEDAPCIDEFTDQADCIAKCDMTNRTAFYDRDDNYDGDDIQCRFLHLIAAVTTGELDHCGHANFESNLHCNIKEAPTMMTPATP